MKRILFLLFIVALLSLGLLYLYDPGFVEVTWLGYEVQFSGMVAIILLFFFFFMLTLIIHLFSWFFDMPLRWISFFKFSQDEKAKTALLQFFSSFEAEVFADAVYHQKKVEKRLSNDPFFLWFSGKIFERVEKPIEAEKYFSQLSAKPSTAFLGLKGQICGALRRRDLKLAQALLRCAEKLTPSSPWILTHLLDVLCAQNNFKEAEALVLRLEDLGHFSSTQSRKYIAFLYSQRALQPEIFLPEKEAFLRKSHALDPSLRETTESLVSLLFTQGYKAEALKILETAWPLAPSQKLGDLYLEISFFQDDIAAYQAAQALIKHTQKDPESLLFLARTALRAKLLQEANTHLADFIRENKVEASISLHPQGCLAIKH